MTSPDDTARVFLAEIELAAAARAADALNGVISATIATIETHSEFDRGQSGGGHRGRGEGQLVGGGAGLRRPDR